MSIQRLLRNLLGLPIPNPKDRLLSRHPALRRNASPNLAERRRRLPPRALPRARHLRVQLINLLKRQALGLVDHEVDEGDAEEAAGEPDEEDLGLEVGVARAVVDEVGGGVGDGPVEEPVGGGGHGEALGTDLEREDLTRDDPA